MASASFGSSSFSSFKRCFHCGSVTTTFKNGWKLSSGTFAPLCSPCGSAYENGTFCDKFHLGEEGWSYCAGCRKMLHCGCINKFITLDFGGICCRSCEKNYGIMEVTKLRESSRAPNRDLPRIELSVDSEETVSGKAKAGFISSASPAEKSEKEQSEALKDSNDVDPRNERIITPNKFAEGGPKIDG